MMSDRRSLRNLAHGNEVGNGESPPNPTTHMNLPGSDDADGSSFDERALQMHFKDVESSFLPDATMATAAVQDESRRGVDDTYLGLGRPDTTSLSEENYGEELKEGMAREGTGREQIGEEHSELDLSADSSEMLPSSQRDDGFEEENSLSPDTTGEEGYDASTGHVGSSPAAAAAKRTHARNVSSTSAFRVDPYRAGSTVFPPHSRNSSGSNPMSSAQRPTSKASTIRPSSPEKAQDPLLPLSRRKGQIGLRQAGSTSSKSSATQNSSGSNDVVDVDYALQTGGSTTNRRALGGSHTTNLLSRLPSFGSVSSYAAEDSVPGPYPGETPRPRNAHFDAPTDTVITRHVRSIQVPDTVARDFRATYRSTSPEKRPVSSGVTGLNSPERSRRNLTLKEQNGKIDKLSKENFDLKLKIHFLDQALQNRSDDGVKELIEKNVQLQTDLANERKESQSMRRKMREMERKLKEQEESLAEARDRKEAKDADDEDPTLQAEMHEEILYLRQQLDHSENQVTTLREEVMTKEFEKRKMAEHMRSMAGTRGEDTAGMKETMDMWQDLLNAETGRREQAEEDLSQLREQLNALRIERASPAANRTARGNRRSRAIDDDDADMVSGPLADSHVALLEQLQHENAELRRDLGAQTSMLTSRNRERERLQQEIEDLKLLQRKSDGARSVTGESIFDRSISRAQQRAPSHVSDHTQTTEQERDEWEQKEGRLRDQNAEMKIKYQELERTHATYLQYVSVLEGDFKEMEEELNECHKDLLKLQAERDETLQAYEEKDAEYVQLREEALAEIADLDEDKKMLESQLNDAVNKGQKLQSKLHNTTDGYQGLQSELREITQSVMSLEDEKQANIRNIQTLEQQIAEVENEIQKWESKCKETDQKNKKLEITQESLHSEITFLREEQEGDKIKIGELEDALSAARQTVHDEQEKLREMQEMIVDERQQRDVLENKSKEEVQKVLDDLNSENSKSKDEVRRLRRALSAKEVEASGWKQRLEELEQNLRQVLGDRDGTKQSLLADIEKLQRDLEITATHLDRAKMDAADKDRLLRHRDGLLESTSLESRRLSDLLDKERASRKHDMEQFEKTSRGQASHLRTIAQKESKVMELETVYNQDKRKMALLEQQFRDQLQERNNLLLALWNRLSTLCGVEWAQNHSLINGEVPSVEIIGKHLPSFNKNILTAVKTIEALIGSFKIRIRGVEKDLSKDYQTLQHNLDMRIRRMDSLEKAIKDTQKAVNDEAAAVASSSMSLSSRPTTSRAINGKLIKNSEETARLKAEIKLLKSELKLHRQHPSALAQQMINNQNAQLNNNNHNLDQQPSRRLSTSASSPARAIAQLWRHHSTPAVEHFRPTTAVDALSSQQQQQPQRDQQMSTTTTLPPTTSSSTSTVNDQRWVHRLKELERRLKSEREARLLDRQGARQRLEEGRLENEELKQMLERQRILRHESPLDGGVRESDNGNGGEEEGSVTAAAESEKAESEVLTNRS